MTAELALARNSFVAALADRIFVAHAEVGGKTEAFAREVLGWGKPVLTLDAAENANLIALGARRVRPADIREHVQKASAGAGSE